MNNKPLPSKSKVKTSSPLPKDKDKNKKTYIVKKQSQKLQIPTFQQQKVPTIRILPLAKVEEKQIKQRLEINQIKGSEKAIFIIKRVIQRKYQKAFQKVLNAAWRQKQNSFLRKHKIQKLVDSVRKIELKIIKVLWKGFIRTKMICPQRKQACSKIVEILKSNSNQILRYSMVLIKYQPIKQSLKIMRQWKKWDFQFPIQNAVNNLKASLSTDTIIVMKKLVNYEYQTFLLISTTELKQCFKLQWLKFMQLKNHGIKDNQFIDFELMIVLIINNIKALQQMQGKIQLNQEQFIIRHHETSTNFAQKLDSSKKDSFSCIVMKQDCTIVSQRLEFLEKELCYGDQNLKIFVEETKIDYEMLYKTIQQQMKRIEQYSYEKIVASRIILLQILMRLSAGQTKHNNFDNDMEDKLKQLAEICYEPQYLEAYKQSLNQMNFSAKYYLTDITNTILYLHEKRVQSQNKTENETFMKLQILRAFCRRLESATKVFLKSWENDDQQATTINLSSCKAIFPEQLKEIQTNFYTMSEYMLAEREKVQRKEQIVQRLKDFLQIFSKVLTGNKQFDREWKMTITNSQRASQAENDIFKALSDCNQIITLQVQESMRKIKYVQSLYQQQRKIAMHEAEKCKQQIIAREQLREQMKKIEQDLQGFQQQVQKLNLQKQQADQKAQQAFKKMERARQQARQYEMKEQEYIRKIRLLDQNVSSLKESLEGTQNQLVSNLKKSTRIQDSKRSESQELNQKIENLEQFNNFLNERVAQADQKLVEERANYALLQHQLKCCNNQLEQSNQTIKNLQYDLNYYKTKLITIQSQNQALYSNNRTLNQKLIKLHNQIHYIKSREESLKEQVANFSHLNESLSAKLAEAELKIEAFGQKEDSFQYKMQILEYQKSHLMKQMQEKVYKFFSLKMKQQDLKDQFNKLLMIKAKLEADILQQDKQLNEFQGEQQKTQEQLNNVRKQCEQLRKYLFELQQNQKYFKKEALDYIQELTQNRERFGMKMNQEETIFNVQRLNYEAMLQKRTLNIQTVSSSLLEKQKLLAEKQLQLQQLQLKKNQLQQNLFSMRKSHQEQNIKQESYALLIKDLKQQMHLIKMANQETIDIKIRLMENEKKQEQLQKRVNDQQTIMNNIEQENEDLRLQIQRKSQQIKVFIEVRTKMEQQILNFKESTVQQKSIMKQYCEHYNKLQRQLIEQKIDTDKLRQENQELKSISQGLKNKISQLQQTQQQLHGQISELQARIGQTKWKDEKIEELQDIISAKNVLCEDLNSRLNGYMEDYNVDAQALKEEHQIKLEKAMSYREQQYQKTFQIIKQQYEQEIIRLKQQNNTVQKAIKIEKLEEEKRILSYDGESVIIQMDSLREQRQRLQKYQQQLQAQKQQLKAKEMSLSFHEQLKQDNQSLKLKIKEIQIKQKQQQKLIDTLKIERERIEVRQKVALSQLTLNLSKNKSLVEQNNQLRNRILQQEKSQQQFNQTIIVLQNENSSVIEQMKLIQNEKQKLQDELLTLTISNRQLESQKWQNDKQYKELSDRIVKMQQQNIIMQKKLREEKSRDQIYFKSQKQSLNKSFGHVKKESEQLQAKLDQRNLQLANAKQQIQRLLDIDSGLRKKLKEQSSLCQLFKRQLDQQKALSQHRTENLEDRLNFKEKQIKQMAKKLSEYTQYKIKVEESQKLQKNYFRDLQKIGKQLQRQQRQKSAVEQAYKLLQKQFKLKQQFIDDLYKQKGKFQVQLDKSTEENKRLAKNINEYKNQIKSMDQVIKQLQNDIQKIKSQLQFSVKQNHSKNQIVSAQKQTIQAYQQRNTQNNQKIQMFKKMVLIMTEQNDLEVKEEYPESDFNKKSQLKDGTFKQLQCQIGNDIINIERVDESVAQSLKQIQKQLQRKQINNKMQILKLKQKIQQLKSDIQCQQEKVRIIEDNSQKKMRQLQESKEGSDRLVNKLQKQLIQSSNEINKLIEQNKSLNSQIRLKQTAYAQFKYQKSSLFDKLIQQVQNWKQKVSQEQQYNSTLRKQMLCLEKIIQKADGHSVHKLQQQIDSLKQIINIKQQLNFQYENKIKELEAKSQALFEIQQENLLQSQQLKHIQHEQHNYSIFINTVERNQDKTSKKMQELQNQIEKLQYYNDQLIFNFNSAIEKNEKLNEIVIKMNDQATVIKEKVSQLEEEIIKKDVHTQGIQRQLQKLFSIEKQLIKAKEIQQTLLNAEAQNKYLKKEYLATIDRMQKQIQQMMLMQQTERRQKDSISAKLNQLQSSYFLILNSKQVLQQLNKQNCQRISFLQKSNAVQIIKNDALKQDILKLEEQVALKNAQLIQAHQDLERKLLEHQKQLAQVQCIISMNKVEYQQEIQKLKAHNQQRINQIRYNQQQEVQNFKKDHHERLREKQQQLGQQLQEKEQQFHKQLREKQQQFQQLLQQKEQQLQQQFRQKEQQLLRQLLENENQRISFSEQLVILQHCLQAQKIKNVKLEQSEKQKIQLINAVTMQKKQLATKNKDLQQKNRQTRDSLDQLQKEVSQNLQKVIAQNKKMKQRLIQANQQLQKIKQQLDQQIAFNKTQIDIAALLEQQKDDLQCCKQQLQQQAKKREEKINQNQQVMVEIQLTVNQKQRKIRSLIAEKGQIEDEMILIKRKCDVFQQKILQVESQFRTAQSLLHQNDHQKQQILKQVAVILKQNEQLFEDNKLLAEKLQQNNRKISETVENNKQIMQQYCELKQEATIKQNNQIKMKEQIQKMQLMIKELSQTVRQARQQVQILEMENKYQAQEIGQLTAKLESQLNQKQLLNENIQKYDQKLNTLNKIMKEKEKSIKVFEDQINIIDQKFVNLQKKYKAQSFDAQNELLSSKRQIKMLVEELFNERSNGEFISRLSEDNIKRMNQHIQTMQCSYQMQLRELTLNLQFCEKQKNHTKKCLLEIEKDYQVSQLEIKKLRIHNRNLQNQLEACSSPLAISNIQKLSETKAEYIALQHKFRNSDSKIQQLQDQIVHLCNKNKSLTREYEILKSKQKKLTISIQEREINNEQFNIRYNQMKIMYEKEKRKNNVHQDRNAELQKSKNTAKSIIFDQKKKIAQLEKEVSQLKSELKKNEAYTFRPSELEQIPSQGQIIQVISNLQKRLKMHDIRERQLEEEIDSLRRFSHTFTHQASKDQGLQEQDQMNHQQSMITLKKDNRVTSLEKTVNSQIKRIQQLQKLNKKLFENNKMLQKKSLNLSQQVKKQMKRFAIMKEQTDSEVMQLLRPSQQAQQMIKSMRSESANSRIRLFYGSDQKTPRRSRCKTQTVDRQQNDSLRDFQHGEALNMKFDRILSGINFPDSGLFQTQENRNNPEYVSLLEQRISKLQTILQNVKLDSQDTYFPQVTEVNAEFRKSERNYIQKHSDLQKDIDFTQTESNAIAYKKNIRLTNLEENNSICILNAPKSLQTKKMHQNSQRVARVFNFDSSNYHDDSPNSHSIAFSRETDK